MQQIYANLYPNTHKMYEAVSSYNMGISILLMKLHSNPLLPEVQNNIITRFFSESAEIFLEKSNEFIEKASKPQNAVDIFRESYSQMVKLSHDYLNAWQKSSTDFINYFTPNITQEVEQKDLLHKVQSYYKDVLQIMEKNVSRTIDDMIGNHESKDTVQFLWNEFKKFFNHKNAPWLQENIDPEMFNNGAKMFLDDVRSSPDGYFLINTVDRSKFQLGKNIAATKGSVVFKNDLMELICYESTTENVHKTPILIVTAWINKYYVLDLDPQYSYVKWLVDNGYRVFIISWVNPDERLANKSLTDYMKDGLLQALDNVKQIANVDEVNCVGYCMGGTLLSIAAAYLGVKGQKGIKSITLLTTLTDFERCGPVKVFITDEMIESIERHMEKQGYISGYDMFSTFSIIKSNDMIWHYFVNKYLLGKEPKAIDVLYWNSDSTRIPYKLHQQCLRDLYQANLLASGQLKLDNTKIDLGNVKCPIYSFATEDDHIAPWESVYKGLNLCKNSSNKRFVLSKSGHVAAVINHPDKNKYGYWSDQSDQKKPKKLPELSNQWLDEANYKDGSWWGDWNQWMISSNLNGGSVPAQSVPQDKILEQAPGSYVKVR